MLLKIHPENPESRKIKMVVDCLRDGGIIIYPTDTIYGLGCDINKPKAVERIARLKDMKVEKANFSFICFDLKDISDYTRQFDTWVYKLMKKALPGPFTFILNANNNVPRLFQSKKKTVGIRVPANNIARAIVLELGNPIMTTSLHHADNILQYPTDPEEIYEEYKNKVDVVIDGGYGNNLSSTVVDCTENFPYVLRQGAGNIEQYYS
jgi:tRNA threonylcarbamoyl adenosine modification protein (Sua5/YciO/YrdC/YwlC family)